MRSSYLFNWISTKRENEQEVLFKEVTVAVNFLNLRKNINIHIQEGLQTPSRIKKKKSTSRHITVQMQKIEDTLYCLLFPKQVPSFFVSVLLHILLLTPSSSCVQMLPIIY